MPHRAFGTYWSYPSVAEIIARELPGCLVRVHSHGLHVPRQTLDTIADFCHADPEREKHILILVGQNDAHQWSLPGTTRVEDLAVSMEEFRAWVLRQMERLVSRYNWDLDDEGVQDLREYQHAWQVSGGGPYLCPCTVREANGMVQCCHR